MFRLIKREEFAIDYDWSHFKKFIKIFSFTSASKIITGISYSIDMIVLARFISPAAITMYEINKRPINITYSLIGRHSVALTPLISHAKGSGDKESILELIRKQFRFYCYAALFASFLFIYNYENLVTAWTGQGQFAGQLIINLLVGNFIVNLISYFIANVGYSLGDIKMNSLYNIIRNIFFGLFMFLAARYYGIVGTVIVSIAMSLVFDLSFYTWRLKKLGYFDASLWRNIFSLWLVIIPACFLAEWGLKALIAHYVPDNMYFLRLIINGASFTLFFIALILLIDTGIRQMAQQFLSRFLIRFSYRKATA
jgi:O-antigen/teichoic acid export membrane protein